MAKVDITIVQCDCGCEGSYVLSATLDGEHLTDDNLAVTYTPGTWFNGDEITCPQGHAHEHVHGPLDGIPDPYYYCTVCNAPFPPPPEPNDEPGPAAEAEVEQTG